MLIEAIEIVLQEREVKLIIIGEGEDKLKIETKMKEIGIDNKVLLLGYKDNPYKYIYNSDVFVLPSIYEGLSNALLEALACNILIITTDNPDGIIKNGLNGFQADLTKQSIADTIIRLLNNKSLRESIIKNNNEYMNAFDVLEMKAKYEDIFDAAK